MKIKELLENQATFIDLFNRFEWEETIDQNRNNPRFKEFSLNEYKAIVWLKDPKRLTIKRWEITDTKRNKVSRGTNYVSLEKFVVEYDAALQQMKPPADGIDIDISQLPNADPNIGGTV